MGFAHASPGHPEDAEEGSRPKFKGEHLPSDDTSVPGSNFECSICLELSQDPVVTMCGHLFCWPCLHQWITIHSSLQECPVCKACVKDKIIPLYGRGKAGFNGSKTKTIHEFDVPRPRRHSVAAASTPSSTVFQQHGIISHENYVSRGGQSMSSSAACFGLFPALFGFHILTPLDYGIGFSSGTAHNASFRLPSTDRLTSQQQRLNAQQGFVLYSFLVLLACFTVLCLLLF